MELASIDVAVKATDIGKIGSSKVGRHKNCPKISEDVCPESPKNLFRGPANFAFGRF